MIALIGSGNVAHWVARRLADSEEFRIGQVYSRQLSHAQALAEEMSAQAIDDLAKLDPRCELFLFALKDDAYADAMRKLPFKLPVALHTAGAISQQVFDGYAEEYGVLYPLQTFSKSAAPQQKIQVPLCMETNRIIRSKLRVRRLAERLSPLQYEVNEAQRAVLHLAAVYACNFSNAMAFAADEILRAQGLSLQLLLPLMQQTVDKLSTMSPADAQTGPAVRRDYAVMDKHLSLLSSEELQRLYREISAYILHFSTPK